MISADDVNKAFDALESAFTELAKIEDKQQEIATDLAEFKDGSRKADQLKKKLQDLQPKMAEAQRAYRLAGMRADRVRLLLDVAKTSMGRD
jgi:ATPase subunit of ABC transporter with duplicated ATPase domains